MSYHYVKICFYFKMKMLKKIFTCEKLLSFFGIFDQRKLILAKYLDSVASRKLIPLRYIPLLCQLAKLFTLDDCAETVGKPIQN